MANKQTAEGHATIGGRSGGGGGGSVVVLGTELGLLGNRKAFAATKNLAFNDFSFSNLHDGASLRSSTTNLLPVVGDPSSIFSQASAYVGFNASAPGAGVAAIDQPLIANPTAESWLISARVKFPLASFTAGTFTIPLGLFGGTPGSVYLQSVVTDVPKNTVSINFFDTSDHFFTGGPVATLGTATMPIGIFFWISLEFNVSTGVVTPYFSDVAGTARSGADLTHFITGPGAPLFAYNNDNNMKIQLSHIFMAKVASL